MDDVLLDRLNRFYGDGWEWYPREDELPVGVIAGWISEE